MTPRYPGAVWMPSGQDQGANNGPTAFSWHEAVTTGTKEAIAGWVSSENACHAFVGQHGDTAQYKDFDRVAYGVLNGNRRGVVTIETWDNLLHGSELTPDGRDANNSDWDAGQCERIADMIAWADVALGIPIRFMSNTREAGHAPHRLGVPQAGGRVQIGYGPDSWTSHPGKSCPGDMRVLCLRDVAIPRARVIAAAVRAGKCTWLPQGPVNLTAALARTGGAAPAPTQNTTPEDPDMSAAEVKEIKDYIDAKFRQASKVNGTPMTLAELTAWTDWHGYNIERNTQAIAAKLGVELPPAKVYSPPAPAPAKPITDTVKQGETLTAFATRNKTTVAAVVAANRAVITNPDVVGAGQVLNLPK